MPLFHYRFSWRKAHILASFVGQDIRRFVDGGQLHADDTVFVWGDTPIEAGPARCIRVEDGFLRSAGLGAGLVAPLSWVFDQRGLHHWGQVATDLEHLIVDSCFSVAQLERAARLRARLVENGLSKYNVGTVSWQPLSTVGSIKGVDKPRVLVVGQVPDDAALRGWHGDVCTNLALLNKVRLMRPDAWLLYKRHPDVVASLRDSDEPWMPPGVDELIEHASLPAVLPWVQEVHVLNSLAGFEALLRRIPVVCHAQPFYAGWGLTTDLMPPSRRGVERSLDHLVAAALIAYPRYRHPVTRAPCEVEVVLDHVAVVRQRELAQPVRTAIKRMGQRGMALGVKCWQKVVGRIALGDRHAG